MDNNKLDSFHKFPFRWTLAGTHFSKDKGSVFSCFACGGGSTMGYKLAGYDVIGACEIDKRMMEVYQANLHPKYPFLCSIQELKTQKDLPSELYSLDILDGSPPCLPFSMCGIREKSWGVSRKFNEGQTEQVIDTLFFDFIDLAARLQPKVVVAENVPGLLMGKAKAYVERIYFGLAQAGYIVNHYLLDGSLMGVPQTRKRVFFVALRQDLVKAVTDAYKMFKWPDMAFSEDPILFGEVVSGTEGKSLPPSVMKGWGQRKMGDRCVGDSLGRKNYFFNYKYLYPDKVANTATAKSVNVLFDQPRFLNRDELVALSTFPTDYDFKGRSPNYICGMSVPPVMMAQVASRIWERWLSVLGQ